MDIDTGGGAQEMYRVPPGSLRDATEQLPIYSSFSPASNSQLMSRNGTNYLNAIVGGRYDALYTVQGANQRMTMWL
jgi:hypothetical protein